MKTNIYNPDKIADIVEAVEKALPKDSTNGNVYAAFICLLHGIHDELGERYRAKFREVLVSNIQAWGDGKPQRIISAEAKEALYDKPAWSEENKDYYDAIIGKLEVTKDDAALTDNQMNFLKSLKQRIGG